MTHTSSNEIPLNERPVRPTPPVADAPLPPRRYSYRRSYGGGLNAVFWAGLLILVGAVLLADQMSYLPRIGDADKWDWIMLGAGGLLLLDSFIRAVSVDYGRPSTGRVVLGVILVGLGASAIFSVSSSLLWPAALIVIGVYLLTRNLTHR